MAGGDVRSKEAAVVGVEKLQQLNNNFKCSAVRYVALFSTFFRYPIYGILTKDFVLKLHVTQGFKEKSEFNLKNLLIALFEFTSEVLQEKLKLGEDDIKLMIYLKRSCFENESKLLIKNLNWLGGKLLANDDDDTNKYNDWYIMEFEV